MTGAVPPTRKAAPSTLAQAAAQRDWNTVRLDRLRGRNQRSFDFVTAGSSGKSPADLLRYLRLPVFANQVLIDIRERPLSQHTPEWNQRPLAQLLAAAGVIYVHRPDLGVPPEVRRRLRAGRLSYPRLFDWYGREVATPERLSSLATWLPRRPVFLCTELAPTSCHRGRLAEAIEGSSDGVSYDL